MPPPLPRPAPKAGAGAPVPLRPAGRVGLVVALALLALLAPACGHPTADAEACQTSGLTYENFGLGFTATYCRSCHSSVTPDRRGAPDGTNFDTEAEVTGLASSIRRTVLDDGTMPIGGGVQPVDLERLDAWLTCVE